MDLEPGESRNVTITTDPRLLARFDGSKHRWRLDEGTYGVTLSRSATDPVAKGKASESSTLTRQCNALETIW